MKTIRTKTDMFDDYMEHLNGGYRKVMDQAKKEGIILSHQILSKEPTNPEDWSLMLLVEYKNYAAFDGISDKMDGIIEKLFGGGEATQNAGAGRDNMCTIIGTVTTRQLIFK